MSDEAKPIEASIVSAPEAKKMGRKWYIPVYKKIIKDNKETSQEEILQLTEAEMEVLMSFTKTFDYYETAVETGLKVESIKRMLRRETLKAYLEELIRRAALKTDTNISWFVKECRDIFDGKKEKTAIQMKALDNIKELLRPKTPGVNININSGLENISTMEQINNEWDHRREAAAE